MSSSNLLQAEGKSPVPAVGLAPSAAIDLTEFKASWRIIVVSLLGLAVAANASMLYAFGSLVLPLQAAFGWTRGEIQPAISFLFGGAVLAAHLGGMANHRWGLRRVTPVSLIALAAVFAAMTLMGKSIWWYYALCALLPIAGMGTMHITWTHLVNLWFERNRGLALALMLSGTGLSATFLPAGVAWAVERWGWQAAFWLLAALPVVLVLPLSLRWMKLPSDAVAGATAAENRATASAAAERLERQGGMPYGEAMRSARYWALNLALMAVVGVMVTMVSNTVPLLRDNGLSAAEAGRIFGAFGLSLIGGRVLVGYLIDRLWAPGVAAVALTLPALGCLLLHATAVDQPTLLMLATMLVGVGAGAEFDIAAYLMSRYFGMRDYARLFGLHCSLITLAATLTPWGFGLLYTAAGSYTAMLTICGLVFLLAPLALLLLGRYPQFTASSAKEAS